MSMSLVVFKTLSDAASAAGNAQCSPMASLWHLASTPIARPPVSRAGECARQRLTRDFADNQASSNALDELEKRAPV